MPISESTLAGRLIRLQVCQLQGNGLTEILKGVGAKLQLNLQGEYCADSPYLPLTRSLHLGGGGGPLDF